ncbi:zinc-dependent alcohol dehydrogenase family protein [Myroides injenensis]|uniref:zinc-dependent alcohol dehydrogenase family protein n=1 Tax=Myroides injenensis TaxID=1183151 RepID=UPI00028A2B33|nr:zinc-dependent alcohol dehydrogenase family protein [Myroides injenensis]
MKIKAAILREMGRERPYSKSMPLTIEEVELDKPQRREVLVKIKAAGLCHSDLSVINGDRPRPLPMALGHEAAGIIIEKGEEVNDFEVGDHVVFSFLPSCGHCIYCQTGRVALCEKGAKANGAGTLLGGAIRLHQENDKIYHHLGVSGFADHVVASIDSLVKIDKAYPFEIAALFGCAVMTGVGAVMNTAQLKLGESVMVVGLGGVGLAAILGAKAAGAKKVLAADISKYKLDVAKELGATEVFDSSKEGIVKEVKDYTKENGVDASVEFAGAMPALDFAFHVTKRGGRTITGALPAPDKKFVLDPLLLVGDEKTLKGCYLGSCVPLRDIPAYLELYKEGKLPVEQLITHRLKLEDINEGFDRLASGEAIRQVILFD